MKTGSNKYLLYALALTATATMGAALPAQAGLFGISEQQEIQAGRDVAAQAEKEFGGALPYNHPMSVRVRTIGQQFARLSTRRSIPYTYKVLNNDKVLNAFAAPGGPIYVTRKLLTTTANDAELAYVLGHETAHIDRKHIVESVERQQKVGLGVGILGAILGRGSGGNIIGAVANVGFTVWSRGYSRDHENESDIVGVRWMSQLGYDPRAAVSMLGKLGGGSGGGLDRYLSTHPAPKSRQDNVNRLIASERLLDVARRQGGPRLSSNINYDNGVYGNDNYYAQAPTDGYSTPNSGNQSYYPPDDNGSPTYYPPDNNSQPGYYPPDDNPNYYPPSQNTNYPSADRYQDRQLNFGAPLRLRAISRTEGVVMAPVRGFTQWAGASMSTRGDLTTIRRGNDTLVFRLNSRVVDFNGRSLTMRAPVVTYNGVLYAPLGYMAGAVGADTFLDEDTRVVRITLEGRSGYLPLPRQ